MFTALLLWDNVITPTLNTPTIITPTLNISTVTDSLFNSGAFSNPNAVQDCPFNLKGAWFLSWSRKFFFVCSAIVLKAFQRGPTKYFLQKKILFHIDLMKMLSLISLFLHIFCNLNLTFISYRFWNKGRKVSKFWKFDEK
jgi:hypothetical protein